MNQQHSSRRIGFEIEYTGLSIEQSAMNIQSHFGGKLVPINKDTLHIDTDAGQFRVELDVHFMKNLSNMSVKNLEKDKIDIEGAITNLVRPAISAVMPVEIVTPPLNESDFNKLDQLVTSLRLAGAKGTNAAIHYAFGLHINPELKDFSSKTILNHMRAYALLYDYIHSTSKMDITRIASRFAKNYSYEYLKLILDEAYQPSLKELMLDYINYANSRNYALDCYPLFMFLDKPLIKKHITDPLINPRPTFHFRLLNSMIDVPNWNISHAFKYWRIIEQLANNPKLLQNMSIKFLSERHPLGPLFSKKWSSLTKQYLEEL